MYDVGPSDRVYVAPDIPQPSAGATEPTVVSNDHGTALVYYVAESWPPGTGDDATSTFDRVATVVFTGVRGVFFGAPNDEALDNHPLYQRGLGFYGAFRVDDSSWAAALERLAIKRGSARLPRPALTHYIVAMHDNTFECVARGHTARVDRVAVRDAIVAALAGLEH